MEGEKKAPPGGPLCAAVFDFLIIEDQTSAHPPSTSAPRLALFINWFLFYPFFHSYFSCFVLFLFFILFHFVIFFLCVFLPGSFYFLIFSSNYCPFLFFSSLLVIFLSILFFPGQFTHSFIPYQIIRVMIFFPQTYFPRFLHFPFTSFLVYSFLLLLEFHTLFSYTSSYVIYIFRWTLALHSLLKLYKASTLATVLHG